MNPHLAESVSFMVASTETDYGRLAPSPKSQLGLLTGAGGRALFPVSSGSGFGVRFWIGLLGFMSLPVQVSAGHLHGVPMTVVCACLSDFLGGAGAVGVASSADRRPHEIPIEEVADYFGPHRF